MMLVILDFQKIKDDLTISFKLTWSKIKMSNISLISQTLGLNYRHIGSHAQGIQPLQWSYFFFTFLQSYKKTNYLYPSQKLFFIFWHPHLVNRGKGILKCKVDRYTWLACVLNWIANSLWRHWTPSKFLIFLDMKVKCLQRPVSVSPFY